MEKCDPRRIKFTVMQKPQMGLVYDLAKCTPDLWTSPHLTEFDFVEASHYDALKQQLAKYEAALKYIRTRHCEETDCRYKSGLAEEALASLKGGPDGKV